MNLDITTQMQLVGVWTGLFFFFFFLQLMQKKKKGVFIWGFWTRLFFMWSFILLQKSWNFFVRNSMIFLEKPKIKQPKHLLKLPDFYAWFKLVAQKKKKNKDLFLNSFHNLLLAKFVWIGLLIMTHINFLYF